MGGGGGTFFDFIWYESRHNVSENVSKCFNLPVRIRAEARGN